MKKSAASVAFGVHDKVRFSQPIDAYNIAYNLVEKERSGGTPNRIFEKFRLGSAPT